MCVHAVDPILPWVGCLALGGLWPIGHLAWSPTSDQQNGARPDGSRRRGPEQMRVYLSEVWPWSRRCVRRRLEICPRPYYRQHCGAERHRARYSPCSTNVYLALEPPVLDRDLGLGVGFSLDAPGRSAFGRPDELSFSTMEQNPTLAYASLVDSYAGDADIVQRLGQIVCGFELFLQEGYQYKPQGRPPSSFALQAISTTVFELDYTQVRECRIAPWAP